MVSTASRVARHTSASVAARLRREAGARIAWYAANPEGIEARLAELDREWDIERAIEANAASLALAGAAMALAADRRWIALPTLVAGFLLQHAIQGWCPPVPVLRRLGFRTAEEISQERYALKALRGDFRNAARDQSGAPSALRAVGLSAHG